jgi:hypothetical protein
MKKPATARRRNGTTPCAIYTRKSSEGLEHSRLPLAWHDQRIVLGFG